MELYACLRSPLNDVWLPSMRVISFFARKKHFGRGKDKQALLKFETYNCSIFAYCAMEKW